jgi:hypothetical protein
MKCAILVPAGVTHADGVKRDACEMNIECIGLEQRSRVDELLQLKNLP